MKLKIISLNIAGFKDWDLRKQKIVDFLNYENADIILLQEVRFDASISGYNQSTQLNQSLSEPLSFTQSSISQFYQPSIGPSYREGLAILSKYPIADSEALALAKRPDDNHPRIIQNTDIVIDKQIVHITNIHLSNNQYSTEQLRELLDIIKSRKEKRIIVGDFNIFDLRKECKLYSDSYKASIEFISYISFPLKNQTLDYVLMPNEYSFTSLETRKGLSDHNALLFTANLAKQL